MKSPQLNAKPAKPAERSIAVRPLRALRSTFLIAACVTVAVPVSATVVIPADMGELSRDAVAIVRGRVSAIDARYTEDRRTIETTVTLEVENALKGTPGPTLQFRVPGGELGRFRSIVVGAPEFSVGQRVVVFLGARGPSVPYVLGLNQGVFRLVRTAGNDEWLVTPPALLPSAAGATPIVRGDPARRPLPLGEFESRVRALVGGAR